MFGSRSGAIEMLINQYKFDHRRGAVRELADLLSPVLPYSRGSIVPVPTINRHIRERGFDHMALLAKVISRRNRLTYAPVLVRYGQTVQHGATKAERIKQSREAFKTRGDIDPDATYFVIDDITTTGSSLRAAARVLREAGATRIHVVALARQPLESTKIYSSALLDDRG